MDETTTIQRLKERLQSALKTKAVLSERSKRLEQQVEDFRKREDVMGHVACELIERQRELNFMLHRASSVLHQLQDTNQALSAEFTHIVKELPAPADSDEWSETVAKVNNLFEKTHELAAGMQDELFKTSAEPDKSSTWADFFTPAAKSAKSTEKGEAQEAKSEPEPPEVTENAPEPEHIIEAEIGEEPSFAEEAYDTQEAVYADSAAEAADIGAPVEEPATESEEASYVDSTTDVTTTEPTAATADTDEEEALDDIWTTSYATGEADMEDEDRLSAAQGGKKSGFFSKLFKRD